MSINIFGWTLSKGNLIGQPGDQGAQGEQGSPGIGFNLSPDGNYAMLDKRLVNVGKLIDDNDAVNLKLFKIKDYMNHECILTLLWIYIVSRT